MARRCLCNVLVVVACFVVGGKYTVCTCSKYNSFVDFSCCDMTVCLLSLLLLQGKPESRDTLFYGL